MVNGGLSLFILLLVNILTIEALNEIFEVLIIG